MTSTPPEDHSPGRALFRSPRLGGALIAVFGGGLFFLAAGYPILQARRGDPKVEWLSGKVAAGGVLLLVLGLMLLAGGRAVLECLNPPPTRSKVPVYLFSIALVAAAFGAYFAVEWYIEALGYTIR